MQIDLIILTYCFIIYSFCSDLLSIYSQLHILNKITANLIKKTELKII